MSGQPPRIYVAAASTSDRKALKTLLSPLPAAAHAVVHRLIKAVSGVTQGFDEGSGVFIFVGGGMVSCYTVTGLTVEQTAAIAATRDTEIERARAEGNGYPGGDSTVFQVIVEHALGVQFDAVDGAS
jgi:hypothetical protein